MTRFVLLAAAAYLGMTMTTLAASRTYDLPPFDAVSVAQGITAIVDVGGAQSVRAEAASESTLDRLDLRVEGTKLSIRLEGNFFSWLMDMGHWHEIVVHVSAPKLLAASGSSGANLDVNNAKGDAITLDSSSGASVSAQLEIENGVVVGASSGGNLTATGTCGHLAANASSGGNADASKLSCKDATVDASSGGHVSLDASNSVVANASSGGGIDVVRRPPSSNVNTSSGGSVRFGQ